MGVERRSADEQISCYHPEIKSFVQRTPTNRGKTRNDCFRTFTDRSSCSEYDFAVNARFGLKATERSTYPKSLDQLYLDG